MIESLLHRMGGMNVDEVKAWGPVAVGIAAIISGLVANLILIIFQWRNNKRQAEHNERQLALLKSKEHRDEIRERLNKFYGPLKELRTQSKALYAKFELRIGKKDPQGKRFRTLRYLASGNKPTGQEDALIKEILKINSAILELVDKQSGLVGSPALQSLLGKMCAHIKVLQLAYDGKLERSEDFEDISFPLAIDGAVESAILRLQAQLDEMNAKVDTPSLDSKNRWYREWWRCLAESWRAWRDGNKSTIRYYEKNTDAYENATLNLNLSGLYKKFLEHLPRGARILDAGCGIGRDTRSFIEHGFVVISFDASMEMVNKTRQYPHAYCVNLAMPAIPFREEFDGIWCCSVLLHMQPEDAAASFRQLVSALRPGGIIYLSLKVGAGEEKTKEGRFFVYYDESSAKNIYSSDPRVELVEAWRSPAASDGHDQKEWLNLLLRRKQPVLHDQEFSHA